MTNQSIGKTGEDAAAVFLKGKGCRILERNFKCRLGEVDIVACDGETICFVEVKTRSSEDFGLPQEAVSRQKQTQISKTALHYLKTKKLFEKSARFDVVSVLYKGSVPKIDLIKNAFELDSRFSY